MDFVNPVTTLTIFSKSLSNWIPRSLTNSTMLILMCIIFLGGCKIYNLYCGYCNLNLLWYIPIYALFFLLCPMRLILLTSSLFFVFCFSCQGLKQVSFSLENSFSLLCYSEIETLSIASLKEESEVEIAMDLTTQFHFKKLKQVDINVTTTVVNFSVRIESLIIWLKVNMGQ